MTSKFQVNKTYATRSIGDHNCIYSFTILSRTEKTVTVKGTLIDKTARRGLSIGRYDDAEQFKPFGTTVCVPSSVPRKRQWRLRLMPCPILILNFETNIKNNIKSKN